MYRSNPSNQFPTSKKKKHIPYVGGIAQEDAPTPDAPVISSVTMTSDDELTIVWDNADFASSYSISRSTTSGSGFSLIAEDLHSLSYIDSGLVADEYFYIVTAVNPTDEVDSEEANGEVLAPHVSLTGLISHWSLDNFNWLDSHGDNDLTEGGAGSPSTTTGKISNAYSAIAADQDWIAIPSEADLQTGDIDFTITLWVYLTNKSAGLHNILGKANITGGALLSEWRLVYEGNDDDFEFICSNGVSNAGVEDSGSPSTATWYFLACMHDSVNHVIRIYRNADEGSAGVSAFTGGNSTVTEFRIGSVVNGTVYHNGRIDEVSFWKRLLTVDELVILYNGGAGLAYPFGN